jgi:phosphoserine phosphatase
MRLESHSSIQEFTKELTSELHSRILAAKSAAKGPLVAAFDADGTLWDTDMGESFFLYQIEKCGLPNMPKDPWQHYHDMKAVDKVAAYFWLAQINAGQKISQVRDWAKKSVDRASIPILQSQKTLIQFLKDNGFEVYVVTASVKWAVEPAAGLVGIDYDHVLGMQTEIKDDLVGLTPILPATYRIGKAEAVLKKTGGVAPIFCSGNSLGDLELLKSASSVRLAVSTQVNHDKNTIHENHLFEDEQGLQKEARANGWLHHAFRS